MTPSDNLQPSIEFEPLTRKRWADLDLLFGEHGASGGCWCMWWRLTSQQFERQAGRANRQAFKKIVDSGEIPGILAYVGGHPAGWCSVGPREKFGRLERSPVLKRVDEEPVWSLVCYYVDRLYRRQHIMEKLTAAAIDHAENSGARILEAYPVEPTNGFRPADAYTGLAPVLRHLGFVEVLRRSPNRPIMRYYLE